MKLQNFFNAHKLVIQIMWGEKKIEFPANVVDRDSEGLLVTPYIHNGTPLEINIDVQSGVVCNVFGNNPDNDQRISWRNIELNTVNIEGELLYHLKTSAFNSEARVDERRGEERIKINKPANLLDTVSNRNVQIRVHDISDGGLAFYAPSSYQPETNTFIISFSDVINEHEFNLNVKCKAVRSQQRAGNVFYACRVSDDNLDYLLYGCMVRLKKSTKDI